MRKIMNSKRIALIISALIMTGLMTGCGNSSVEKLATTTEAVTEASEESTSEEESKTEDSSKKDESTESGDKDSGKGSDDTSESSEGTEDTTTAADVIDDIKAKEEEASSEEAAKESGTATEGVDVDLTTMSSTMVYSEVMNMMSYPDQYKGKKVRMQGQFQSFKDEETGKTYYYCIIKDATACCANGIEFVLTEGEYPEEMAEVTVEGTFTTYFEGEFEYATLLDATRLN